MAQILFKNAKLLDPRADALEGGVSVLVEGDTIREVSAKPIKAAKAGVIDCKGRTLMPGLIDCHVHVMLSEVNIRYLEAIPLTMMTVRAASLVRAMIDRGFTTVRDTGGADWGMRDGIAQGLLPGPRMFIAGARIGPTGGHSDARRRTDVHAGACKCCNAMSFCLEIATAPTPCARRCASSFGRAPTRSRSWCRAAWRAPTIRSTAGSSRSRKSARPSRRPRRSAATRRRTPTRPTRSRAP